MTARVLHTIGWYLLAGLCAMFGLAGVVALAQFAWPAPANTFVPLLGGLLLYLVLLVGAARLTPGLSSSHRAGGFLLGIPIAMAVVAAIVVPLYPN